MINFDDYNSGASFSIDNYMDLNIQDYNYPGITILPQEPQILSISQNEVVQGQNISPYLTTININHIDSANDYSYSEIKMTLNDSNLIYNIDCTLEYDGNTDEYQYLYLQLNYLHPQSEFLILLYLQ